MKRPDIATITFHKQVPRATPLWDRTMAELMIAGLARLARTFVGASVIPARIAAMLVTKKLNFSVVAEPPEPPVPGQVWPPLLSINTWRPEVVAAGAGRLAGVALAPGVGVHVPSDLHLGRGVPRRVPDDVQKPGAPHEVARRDELAAQGARCGCLRARRSDLSWAGSYCRGQLLTDAVHLRLAQRGEERQGQGVRRGRFGDRKHQRAGNM